MNETMVKAVLLHAYRLAFRFPPSACMGWLDTVQPGLRALLYIVPEPHR